MGLQRSGDCNDDNKVTAIDFTILKVTFGRTVGEPGYDARADFNGDDRITAGDAVLQKVNFGMVGAAPIGPGER